MWEKPQRIAFFAYAHNLAEVTRGIEIARILRKSGVDIRFFTHGGPHETFIRQAGFALGTLPPFVTEAKHERLIGIEQGRCFRPPFVKAELHQYVNEELKVLRAFSPDGVYAGMNLPCLISARSLHLPIIFALPTAATAPFFRHGLATFPESHDRFLFRYVPTHWKNKFFNWIMQRARISINTFNAVAETYGVRPFTTYMGDLFRGDLTLLTDIPELTGLPESAFPQHFHYIGPLFARMKLSIPPGVRRVFSRPGSNIYLSMGSSAPSRVLKMAIRALTHSPYNVVIATTSILNPETLGEMPENVFVTRYLPAPEVNEMADVAVTHGGQGTVQTACWAGTPVVGVALQFEQQANLDMVTRAGMGIRIPIRQFTEENILRMVTTVTRDKRFRENARIIQKKIRRMDGPSEAAGRILSFLEMKSRTASSTHL